MKRTATHALGLVLGLILGMAITVTASQKDLTAARAGPNAAAISVATSADGQIVYLVNNSGFFKSEDGGATFTMLHE
jgi:hypothetical protein